MKIDSSYNEQNVYNTNNNNTNALNSAKFKSMLAELLAATESTEDESSDMTDNTTASVAGGMGAFPMMGMGMMPPPPPPPGTDKVDLEDLIDQALAAGKITAAQAEEYKALLAQMDDSFADEASAASLTQIFQILQAYLPAPGSKEDEEVAGVQKTPEEIEEQRLADLEEAIAAAKEAGELTDEQYELISEFLATQKNFAEMMTALRPELPEFANEETNTIVASTEETTDSTTES
jgi:hypothetical protein